MKMAAQFYIYILAKAYISTTIYMSVDLKNKQTSKNPWSFACGRGYGEGCNLWVIVKW